MAASTRRKRPASRKQFLRRLNSLGAKHRKLLKEHMGKPPDWRNIPDRIWKQIDDELAQALIMLQIGIILQQLGYYLDQAAERRLVPSARPGTDILTPLRRVVEQSQRKIVRKARQTTQKKLRDWFDRHPETTAAEAAKRGLTPHRMKMIAIHAFTRALELPRLAVYDYIRDRDPSRVSLIWRLGDCDHCNACPPLDGTAEPFWRNFAPNGPPIHPFCCCYTELFFESEADLRARGLMVRRTPSAQRVVDAFVRDGIRVF